MELLKKEIRESTRFVNAGGLSVDRWIADPARRRVVLTESAVASF